LQSSPQHCSGGQSKKLTIKALKVVSSYSVMVVLYNEITNGRFRKWSNLHGIYNCWVQMLPLFRMFRPCNESFEDGRQSQLSCGSVKMLL